MLPLLEAASEILNVDKSNAFCEASTFTEEMSGVKLDAFQARTKPHSVMLQFPLLRNTLSPEIMQAEKKAELQ